jgi:transcriptional regulator with XRE-family HTH domain
MIEAAQIRAARALIGWSRARLAEKAGVPVSYVERFEACASDEAPDRMRAALEAAGVVFIPKDEGGGGIGVRLREPHEGEYIGWDDLNASNDE